MLINIYLLLKGNSYKWFSQICKSSLNLMNSELGKTNFLVIKINWNSL